MAVASFDHLRTWLLTSYPQDLLMPCNVSTKHPKFPHKNGQWSWKSLSSFLKDHKKQDFDWGILCRDICVVDIDSHSTALMLEKQFPILTTVPRERTNRGMHYFFQHSTDSGYFNQNGTIIAKVDLKTVHTTGTSSYVVVSPSIGKSWILAPWEYITDTLPIIPYFILEAVARRNGGTDKVVLLKFTENDAIQLRYDHVLQQFDLISSVMESQMDHDDIVEIHLGYGNSKLMRQIMAIGYHTDTTELPDFEGLSTMADYLCATTRMTSVLKAEDPRYRTTWVKHLQRFSVEWVTDYFDSTIIQLQDTDVVQYIPPLKNSEWLFWKRDNIDLAAGTEILRQNRAQFMKNTVHDGVMKALDQFPNNLVMAGGAVLEIVNAHTLQTANDYDLYVVGTEKDADKIFNMLNTELPACSSMQTGNAYTWLFEPGDKYVQLILKVYTSIGCILNSFDISACQIAFQNGTFYCTKAWMHSMRHMTVIVDPKKWIQSEVYRFMKYYNKGFEIFVPGTIRSMFTQELLKSMTNIGGLFWVEQHFSESGLIRESRVCRKSRVCKKQINNFLKQNRVAASVGYETDKKSFWYALTTVIDRMLTCVQGKPQPPVIRFKSVDEDLFHQTDCRFNTLYNPVQMKLLKC